jgi:hypothetical protein
MPCSAHVTQLSWLDVSQRTFVVAFANGDILFCSASSETIARELSCTIQKIEAVDEVSYTVFC